jgi:hypothetical protein
MINEIVNKLSVKTKKKTHEALVFCENPCEAILRRQLGYSCRECRSFNNGTAVLFYDSRITGFSYDPMKTFSTEAYKK